MLGSSCNPCCAGCVVPDYPDTIEVDITRMSTAYGTIVFGENTADDPLGSTVQFTCGGLLYPPDGLYVLTKNGPPEFELQTYGYTDGYTTLSFDVQKPYLQRSPGIGLNIIANFFRAKIVPGTTAPTQAELEASNWNSSCSTTHTVQHLDRGVIPSQFRTWQFESCPFMGTVGHNITRGCSQGIYSHQQLVLTNNNLDGRGCYSTGCAFPAVYEYAARPMNARLPIIESPFGLQSGFSNATSDLLIVHANGPALFRFSVSGIFSNNINATSYVSSEVNSVKLVYGNNKVDAFPQTQSNCPAVLGQFSYFQSQPPCP